MIRQRDIKIIKDVDGKPRVWGWINLSAPEKARRLAAAKPLWGTMPVRTLALQAGIPTDALRRAFDEPYKLRICERTNRARAIRNGWVPKPAEYVPNGVTERRAQQNDVAARLAEIPIDTRTDIQRLMGEPMPGRSALDRRQHGT
jgi:hypothetical protein